MVSFPACPTCRSELGPWEDARCTSHGDRRPSSSADYAVLALEGEAAPVSIYDVQRIIARNHQITIRSTTLSAVMGVDRRFCWSGKGVYGLFRHGRIPGVRTLSSVALSVLAAHGGTLSVSELAFVLKWSGYRFQDLSLASALNRDRSLGFLIEGYWEPKVALEDVDGAREALVEELAIDDPVNGPWPADELLARWAARTEEGLRERQRRLALETI